MRSLSSTTLGDLRRRIADVASDPAVAASRARIDLGVPGLDGHLGGGLEQACLHEIHADATADLAAATGFSLALALRAAAGRPILWARQDFIDAESGRVHAPGLAELGLDPARLLLVRTRDAAGVLRAGAEGARCPALGAVLIEPWGEPRQLDLIASRRLLLAAKEARVTVLILRAAAAEAPSAARTRWLIRSLASRPLEANAPGPPAFALRLLRLQGGMAGQEWRVEWDRDRQIFRDRQISRDALGTGAGFVRAGEEPVAAPLPGALVPFPGDRQAAPDREDRVHRKAG